MKNLLCNNKRFLAGLQAITLLMFVSPTVQSMLNQLGNESMIDFIRGIIGGIYIGSSILMVRIVKKK